jgi:hypothetical protein
VAVAVIRDKMRPRMPDNLRMLCPINYEELIYACWNEDAVARPSFLEAMTRLSAMFDGTATPRHHNNSGSDGGHSSLATAADTSLAMHDSDRGHRRLDSSWTLPSGSVPSVLSMNSSMHYGHPSYGYGHDRHDLHSEGSEEHESEGEYDEESESESDSQESEESQDVSSAKCSVAPQAPATKAAPPAGEVTIAFADISRAASLWDFDPSGMKHATLAYNQLLRSHLNLHGGYEVVGRSVEDASPTHCSTGEGSFCMAFQHTHDALAWCAAVQRGMLDHEWPASLLEHPSAAEEYDPDDNQYACMHEMTLNLTVH